MTLMIPRVVRDSPHRQSPQVSGVQHYATVYYNDGIDTVRDQYVLTVDLIGHEHCAFVSRCRCHQYTADRSRNLEEPSERRLNLITAMRNRTWQHEDCVFGVVARDQSGVSTPESGQVSLDHLFYRSSMQLPWTQRVVRRFLHLLTRFHAG